MTLRFRQLCQLLVIICMSYATQTLAATATGSFAIKGVGLMTCEQYKQSVDNLQVKYAVAGWVDGYVTALNQLTTNTFDYAPWESNELLALIIQRHCTANPNNRVAGVVVSITRQLQRDRLEYESSLIPIYGDDGGLLIYEAVLLRAQQALAVNKLYLGEVGSGFNDETREALRQFQQANELPVTGLPDPATLWRLLRAGDT